MIFLSVIQDHNVPGKSCVIFPDTKSNLKDFTMHDIGLRESESYQNFYCYFNGQSVAFMHADTRFPLFAAELFPVNNNSSAVCFCIYFEYSKLFDAVEISFYNWHPDGKINYYSVSCQVFSVLSACETLGMII